MKVHKWSEIKRGKLSPEEIGEIRKLAEKDIVELNLPAVREIIGKTQA